MIKPLTYAPGDVVKILTLRRQREGNPEEIIESFLEEEYSTLHEAWFNYDKLEFIKKNR